MNSFGSLFEKYRTSRCMLTKDERLEMETENHLFGKRQEEHDVLKDGAVLFQELIASCDGKVYHPIRSFSANEIMEAMEDEVFHHMDSWSTHYRGSYQDRKIFIKIYKRECMDGAYMDRECMDLFINEVVSVAQINHRNVVKLLGYCLEMQSPIVVYELLPNTLYDFLRTESLADQISWENRLRIAIEIADVVTYLHIAKPRPIIHMNIKSNNILLDEQCRPKLTGFYLSIAIPLGETSVKTDHVVGTFGCLDPNYTITCTVTEKVDVYSFGWLLVELLTGKRPIELAEYLEEENLSEELTIDENVLLEIAKRLSLMSDASLPVDKRKIEQLMACVELAGRCIADEPDQRPTMKEVALELRQIEKH